jgi:hypothetical protein
MLITAAEDTRQRVDGVTKISGKTSAATNYHQLLVPKVPFSLVRSSEDRKKWHELRTETSLEAAR